MTDRGRSVQLLEQDRVVQHGVAMYFGRPTGSTGGCLDPAR